MSLEEIQARRRQRRHRRWQRPENLSTSLALMIGAAVVVLSFWGLSRGACRPGSTPAAPTHQGTGVAPGPRPNP